MGAAPVKIFLRMLAITCMVYCTVGIGVAGYAIATDDRATAGANADKKAKTAKSGDALPFDVLDRAVLWPIRIFR